MPASQTAAEFSGVKREENEKGIRRQRESFPGNDSSSILPSLTLVCQKENTDIQKGQEVVSQKSSKVRLRESWLVEVRAKGWVL